MSTSFKQSSVYRFFQRALKVVQATLEGIEEHEIAGRAAALSYYGLLSLFPMLLFIIFMGSQFLESQEARAALFKNLEEILPTAAETVQQVVDQTLTIRGSIGLIGGIGLLWSASTLFNALAKSLNVIWSAPPRPFWRQRIVAVVSVLSIGVLFIVSVTFSALTVVPSAEDGTVISQWVNFSVGLMVTILLFWLVYQLIPNTRENPRAALGGGIVAAVLWQGAKAIFVVYLASGLTNYGAVYGSLASVIALILWAYISALILFVGAVFAAALGKEYWPQNQNMEQG